MKFSEENLKIYAQPISESENEKCKNVIVMVRDALKQLGFSDDNKEIRKMYDDTFAYTLSMNNNNRSIKLFVQGSYANNTNIKKESDVDIAVVQEDVFSTKYRSSASLYPQSDSDYNFVNASYSGSFKDEVELALKNKFGDDVERKNKSIKIHGNTYRKDADSVPCRRYRDYSNDYKKDQSNYVGGIIIISDDGKTIINYPEQHIANGREKNKQTNYKYKKMVRIIKNMKRIMIDCNYSSASNISSFCLESLLWNIPNEVFLKWSIYKYEFEEIINYIVNRMNLDKCKEANGIKPLCSTTQEKINIIKFVNDLKRFYEYD